MKINFDVPLLDLKDAQLKSETYLPLMNGTVHARHPASGNLLFERAQSEPVTLKSLCVEALLANYQDEGVLSGEKKLKRFELASTITTGEADLKAEDITELKALIAKGFGVIAVGRAYALLDPVAAK